jgi:hypothetical protein
MTSLPAALAMTILVGAPPPADPSAAETGVVRVPAVRGAAGLAPAAVPAAVRAAGQAGDRLGAGLSVMTGVRVEVCGEASVQVAMEATGGVTRGRTGGWIVRPEAGPTVRAPGVAPC